MTPQNGVKPEPQVEAQPAGVMPTIDDPLSELTDKERELFGKVNKNLLSALSKEREAREALERAAKKATEDKLKETEDYKTLYQQTSDELAKVKPMAAIAEESEQTLRGVLESQIAELPENMRSLIPSELTTQQQLQWLSKNKALLLKPKAVDIGAGKQGGGAPAGADLTPEEIETARKFGMKPEDYAKFKFK